MSVTQTLCDDDEDAHLLVQISKGELVGQRCDEEYIVQFELWQAALGQADGAYFTLKIGYRKNGMVTFFKYLKVTKIYQN